MNSLSPRQIHLDFHTSPHIHDVASDFDAEAFAATLKEARVTSVTLFAKCHHGMCYYPTQTGTPHPALRGRDLLGEQIEALHRAGIRTPVYTTVVWEEDVAARFPEWRQMHRNGKLARLGATADFHHSQPAGWHFNNFLHPNYQDYMEAHIREVLQTYEADGLFLDILFFDWGAGWSKHARRFREEHGLTGTDGHTHRLFVHRAQRAFMEKFTGIIHGLRPGLPHYYNAGDPLSSDHLTSFRNRGDFATHYELESLPSGFWGYFHFPCRARHAMSDPKGKPWLAMTGRFQKMWGDFGGIKPQAALEYECFRAQALGGAVSVGDQLPPRGILEPAAYRLIGSVFEQLAASDEFYTGTTAFARVGILPASHPTRDPNNAGKSDEGAVLLCDECHESCAVIDDSFDLEAFDLIILADETVVTETLKDKLTAYYANGGRLLLSGRSGLNENGDWALDFLPFSPVGEEPITPTYWRADKSFCPELADTDRVCYSQGWRFALNNDGVETLVERVLPYFQRTDLTYCSHFQAPPMREADAHPAVIGGERFVAFADPVFREARQSGNTAARPLFQAALEKLIGPSPVGRGLPATVLSVPRRHGEDLRLSLLHYVPLRKSLEIDIVDERMSFAGQTLRLPESVEIVRTWPEGEPLERTGPGCFALPAHAAGRLLLEVPNYFPAS